MTSGIKRKALSINDKLNIIKQYDDRCPTETQKEIAEKFNLPVSTLRTILKKRKQIEANALQGGSKRKKIKVGKFEELEKTLLEWFQEARNNSLPVNGPIVTEKAPEIAKKLEILDFTGSSGWIDRFKQRNGIVYRQISGEAEAVDESSLATWSDNILPTLLKDYAPEDVYSADKFGLFFKLLPNKSLVFKHESCHGGKLSKDRLTVLVCTNATGSHKVNLLVIGKSRFPRCFKHVRTYPCEYTSQDRAWMTGDLFISWIQRLDLFFEKKKRKVLLFIDNCPVHSKIIPLKNIKLIFLPPNSTSKAQPLDQGIIKVVKQKYRKKLVQRYLHEMKKNTKKDLIKINVLDALHYISAAWEDVKPETIRKCFHKVKFYVPAQEDLSDNIEEEDLSEFENYPDYVSIDDDLVTSEVRDLDQIMSDRCASPDINAHEESDEEDEECDPSPSFTSGFDAIHTLKNLISSFDNATEILYNLCSIENFIINQSTKHLKRTTLDKVVVRTCNR